MSKHRKKTRSVKAFIRLARKKLSAFLLREMEAFLPPPSKYDDIITFVLLFLFIIAWVAVGPPKHP